MMTGDKIDGAPALAAATVGIATRLGTDGGSELEAVFLVMSVRGLTGLWIAILATPA